MTNVRHKLKPKGIISYDYRNGLDLCVGHGTCPCGPYGYLRVCLQFVYLTNRVLGLYVPCCVKEQDANLWSDLLCA